MIKNSTNISPFIWQFKFKTEPQAFWHDWSLDSILHDNAIKFEQRFFWPAERAITLNGLSHEALWFSSYEFETHEDSYILFPDNRNIKFRKKKMHYKPLLKIENNTASYGTKCKYHLLKQRDELSQLIEGTLLSEFDTKSQVKTYFRQNYNVCDVYKETLTLNLISTLQFSIEFSRLKANDRLFHSLVVESYQADLVDTVVKHLGITQKPQDYISFLKGLSC